MNKNQGENFSQKNKFNKAIHSFSYTEMFIFIALLAALFISLFLILDKVNQKYLIERPLAGGIIKEGVIGSPRFINPVLASSATDRDLTSIIFSGLMKRGSGGRMQADLAESYEVSPDGLTYTFKIKTSAIFHDSTKVTADDIIFTITQIQDGKLKSPYQSSWQSVAVKKIDERTVEFKLTSPYSSFIENTSVGILPYHIWRDLDTDDFTFSDSNLYAVGSGPYKISKISKKKNGLIESITLKSFKNYAGPTAFIDKVKFVFYRNEDELVKAFQKNKINQINAISGEKARFLEAEGEIITNINLSRIFGIFFNANKQELFRNKNIARAIDLSINKQEVVDTVLGGYGQIINSPIPAKIFSGEEIGNIDYEGNKAEAISILEREGWVLGENGTRTKAGQTLSFAISTGDAPELQRAVGVIQKNLKEVGISVDIKIFEIGNLNQSVIRPRDYEALFFGQIVSTESDLFAFWHSSQRNDPGLNISSYTSTRVDGLLERIVSSSSQEEKNKHFKDLEDEIKKDYPAVFIYSPDFIYLTDQRVKNINIDKITLPSERLSHINDWYIRTEKVWNFLDKQN
jgi:peptide/nickel transport system substrate-binding protein